MPRWRRVSLALSLGAAAILPSTGVAVTPSSVPPVLRVFIPGVFAGCSTTSSGSSEALTDLLSLVRPSAFNINPVGREMGAGGPIASAELISDDPQIVSLTIDPRYNWSDGRAFSVNDLIQRIELGVRSKALWADGFHRIARYDITNHRRTLKIQFAAHYASWPSMFQGLEERGTSSSCDLADVAQRPSLGPYLLESLTPQRAVLVANPQFRVRSQQFRTVVLLAGQNASSTVGRPIVDYRYSFSTADLTWSASLPGRSGKIAPSQRIAAVTFSPRSATTADIDVRKVLSWSIDRTKIVNSVFGSVSQALSNASSSLVAQGQTGYPATSSGASYVNASTSTTTAPGAVATAGSHSFDCVVCASSIHTATVNFENGRLRWQGQSLYLRLAVGPSDSSFKIAQGVIRDWNRIGVSVRVIPVTSDRQASQAVAQGAVDAAVTTAPSGQIGAVGASWYGPRRYDAIDFGWRSAVCTTAAQQAEYDFNATTALSTWGTCDQEIAKQFWQRPIVSVPYALQWTNTVVGVVPSNTTRGFLDQIPVWSSLQRR